MVSIEDSYNRKASFSQGVSTHRKESTGTPPASWSVISEPVFLDVNPKPGENKPIHRPNPCPRSTNHYITTCSYLYSPGPETVSSIDSISPYPPYDQTDGYLPTSYFSYGY
jgi:hypothetical protein